MIFWSFSLKTRPRNHGNNSKFYSYLYRGGRDTGTIQMAKVGHIMHDICILAYKVTSKCQIDIYASLTTSLHAWWTSVGHLKKNEREGE